MARQVQEPVPRLAGRRPGAQLGQRAAASPTSRPTASSAKSCSRTPCRRSSRASSCLRVPPKPDEYEHRLAGIRAHNRWLADWCADYAERRAGIGQIFLNDVDDAIDDVKWIKEHGLRGGVLISGDPPGRRLREPAVRPEVRPAVEGLRGPRDPDQRARRHGCTELRQVPGREPAVHHRGRLLLPAAVRAVHPVGRVRTVPEAHVRHDRARLRVDPADVAPARRGDRPDPQDRAHGRAGVFGRAQAASARVGVLRAELLRRRQPTRQGRRSRALRDRPRSLHVGERLPARRRHRARTRASTCASSSTTPTRSSCSNCSRATPRASTASTSTSWRRSRRRRGRPSRRSRRRSTGSPTTPTKRC